MENQESVFSWELGVKQRDGQRKGRDLHNRAPIWSIKMKPEQWLVDSVMWKPLVALM